MSMFHKHWDEDFEGIDGGGWGDNFFNNIKKEKERAIKNRNSEVFLLMKRSKYIEGFGPLHVDDIDISEDSIHVFYDFLKEKEIGWAKLAKTRFNDGITATITLNPDSDIEITDENISFSFYRRMASNRLQIYSIDIINKNHE